MDQLVMEILCQIRAMQLFYHNAHHMVKGPLFPGDHGLFGSFYTELDGQYDSVGERFIGLFGQPLELSKILVKVYNKVNSLPSEVNENKDFFIAGLELEKQLCSMCEHLDKTPDATSGLRQLIGNIADVCEARQYKIKQRVK